MLEEDGENCASGRREGQGGCGRRGCEMYEIAAVRFVDAAFGIRQLGRTIFRRFYKQYSCTFRVNETAEQIEQLLNQSLTKQRTIEPAADAPNNHSTYW